MCQRKWKKNCWKKKGRGKNCFVLRIIDFFYKRFIRNCLQYINKMFPERVTIVRDYRNQCESICIKILYYFKQDIFKVIQFFYGDVSMITKNKVITIWGIFFFQSGWSKNYIFLKDRIFWHKLLSALFYEYLVVYNKVKFLLY